MQYYLKNVDTDWKEVCISLFYLIVLSAKLQLTEHQSVIFYLSCTLYIYFKLQALNKLCWKEKYGVPFCIQAFVTLNMGKYWLNQQLFQTKSNYFTNKECCAVTGLISLQLHYLWKPNRPNVMTEWRAVRVQILTQSAILVEVHSGFLQSL